MSEVTVVATVIIAVFATVSAIVAGFQYWYSQKIARVNYMVALHDKRMEVYNTIDEYLGIFARDGRPDMNESIKMFSKLRTAKFLFPEEVLKIVDELDDKTIDHNYFSRKLEPLINQHHNGFSLSGKRKEDYDKFLEEQIEIEKWFRKQITSRRLYKDFAPYLELPPSV